MAGLSAKVDYMTSQHDGWVEISAPGEDDFNASDKEGYRISLLWEASDQLSVKYAYDDSTTETTQNYFQIYNNTFFFNGGHNGRHRLEKTRFDQTLAPSITDQDGHALVAAWDVSDQLTIKSISSYRQLEEEAFGSYGGIFGVGFHWIVDIE